MPNKNTLFVGKVVHRFSALPSTNEYLSELLLRERPAEGTVVVAEYQTAGRGQMGNSWDTPPGLNLTLSIVFYPGFLPAKDQFVLNQAIALAVRDAVASYTQKPVLIKWPNDVLIGKRKICGILIQNSLNGTNIQSSIVGIGINVNQREFPPHLTTAGSLFLEAGRPIDLDDIMLFLFSTLETRYLQLRQGRTRELHTTYLEQLFQRGERALYTYPDGRQFYGTISDVNAQGKLVIETENREEVFGLKEVTYVL